MIVNQISVFLENEPGKLSAFTHLLRENNIDIRALSIAEVEAFGMLRIIVDDVYATSTILKNAGYVFKITPVLAVPLKDVSGGLAEVVDVLGDNKINIDYIYAFTARQKDKAFVVLRVRDNDRAISILTANGYAPVSQEDLRIDG